MSLFISLIHVCILFALRFEADRFLENFHILSTLILNDSCEVCLCLWMQKQSSDQPTALGPGCVVVQPRPLFTPFFPFPFPHLFLRLLPFNLPDLSLFAVVTLSCSNKPSLFHLSVSFCRIRASGDRLPLALLLPLKCPIHPTVIHTSQINSRSRQICSCCLKST